MSKSLVLASHGLSNKTDADELTRGWLAAINRGMRLINRPEISPESFRMIYWADLMYPEPLRKEYAMPIDDHPDPSGNAFRRDVIKAQMRDYLSDKVAAFWSYFPDSSRITSIRNALRRGIMKDLGVYWDNPAINREIRVRISSAIAEANTEGRPCHLIGHSMGSIATYEVLVSNPDISIQNFFTIGSPLGLGDVMSHIEMEFGQMIMPHNITDRWHNYASKDDPVSFDFGGLADDILGNDGRHIYDVTVNTRYQYTEQSKLSVHSSAGYLMSPKFSHDLAEAIED